MTTSVPVMVIVTLLAFVGADLPPACNISAFIQTFAPLMSSAALCQTATNVSFMPPTAPLTNANAAAICAASECKPLIPVINQIPSCSIGPIDMGAFASAVGGVCGNGTRMPTTPSPKSTASSLAPEASMFLAANAALWLGMV
ncbi:hypothetical protein H310_12942 [Aphanomyces invadans]|uniref:Elicitin n=1 Tax=Aphanomyces invadans TaxID=157072 RepID=A0A024TFN2_9STRA|nr:hypothetical protein H310_12942 [Aphanomyces invadans]ETV92945.1 hypothetical protein H310_12942 [Aphanomyces invadans]|eukprot:XP_008878466.1 hypothetical protein H310_12942 [Aphanomyces invadans]